MISILPIHEYVNSNLEGDRLLLKNPIIKLSHHQIIKLRFLYLHLHRLYSSTDRTRVSEALNSGSIPDRATLKQKKP